MADFTRHVLGAPFLHTFGAMSFVNFTLNQAGDAWEAIIEMPAAATVTKVGFRYGARTGTPPTFKVSLQGVALTTGNPDGTILGGASPASATFTPPADATWNATWRQITLANSIAVTRGQLIAVVIAYDSGTIDGANNSSFTYGFSIDVGYDFPYALINDNGVRTRSLMLPCVSLESSTKVYGYPMLTDYAPAFASNSTPDELALKFRLNSGYGSTFTVLGARIQINAGTGLTILLRLYDTDGTTVLQEVTIDTDVQAGNSNLRFWDVFFDEATLSALTFGSYYRIAVVPQQTTGQFYRGFTLNLAGDWDAYPGGQDMLLSTRTDAGAWTDDGTTRPCIYPIIDDWTKPAGGSGMLVHPGTAGGARG